MENKTITISGMTKIVYDAILSQDKPISSDEIQVLTKLDKMQIRNILSYLKSMKLTISSKLDNLRLLYTINRDIEVIDKNKNKKQNEELPKTEKEETDTNIKHLKEITKDHNLTELDLHILSIVKLTKGINIKILKNKLKKEFKNKEIDISLHYLYDYRLINVLQNIVYYTIDETGVDDPNKDIDYRYKHSKVINFMKNNATPFTILDIALKTNIMFATVQKDMDYFISQKVVFIYNVNNKSSKYYLNPFNPLNYDLYSKWVNKFKDGIYDAKGIYNDQDKIIMFLSKSIKPISELELNRYCFDNNIDKFMISKLVNMNIIGITFSNSKYRYFLKLLPEKFVGFLNDDFGNKPVMTNKKLKNKFKEKCSDKDDTINTINDFTLSEINTIKNIVSKNNVIRKIIFMLRNQILPQSIDNISSLIGTNKNNVESNINNLLSKRVLCQYNRNSFKVAYYINPYYEGYSINKKYDKNDIIFKDNKFIPTSTDMDSKLVIDFIIDQTLVSPEELIAYLDKESIPTRTITYLIFIGAIYVKYLTTGTRIACVSELEKSYKEHLKTIFNIQKEKEIVREEKQVIINQVKEVRGREVITNSTPAKIISYPNNIKKVNNVVSKAVELMSSASKSISLKENTHCNKKESLNIEIRDMSNWGNFYSWDKNQISYFRFLIENKIDANLIRNALGFKHVKDLEVYVYRLMVLDDKVYSLNMKELIKNKNNVLKNGGVLLTKSFITKLLGKEPTPKSPLEIKKIDSDTISIRFK